MTLLQHLPATPDMLPAHVIDNHTHLGSTIKYPDLGTADPLTAADMVEMVGMVDVGCSLPSLRAAAQLVAANPRIRVTVAVHPNDAARLFQCDGLATLDAGLAELPVLATLPKVATVGETSLDYYRTRDTET